MRLTENRIRDMKPGNRTKIVRDEKVTGFGVRITPTGARAFVLDYTHDGRRRLATLGRPGEMSLDEARKRAAAALVRIRDGEGGPLEHREDAQQALRLEDGMNLFFDQYVPRRIEAGRMTDTTANEYRQQWNRLKRDNPRLAQTRIEAVSRADLDKALANMKPVIRNRTIAFLGRVFRFFEIREYRPQHTNPARLLEKSREHPRDRVLSPDELQALAGSLEKGDVCHDAIRFLILTGWRSSEALSLEWHQIDTTTGEITLPRTKTGPQIRVIGEGATKILTSIARVDGNPHVFASRRGTAVNYGRLRKSFADACKAAGIKNARMHDLRRSVASYGAARGLSVMQLQKLLHHATPEMANRYVQRVREAEQRVQNESDRQMEMMMRGADTNVVNIERKRNQS